MNLTEKNINYPEFIIKTFGQLQPTTESTIGTRKEFRDKILKRQLELDKNQISKDTFIERCNGTVKELKKYVNDGIDSEKYKKDKNSIFSLINKSDASTSITNESTPKTNGEVCYNSLLINIPNLTKTAKIGELCYNDIKFIESVFKNIDLDDLLQPKLIKLSNSSEGEKVNSDDHTHIFAKDGFKLFQHMLENYIRKGYGGKDDTSYFYRRMYDDKFIHQGLDKFRDWFEAGGYGVLGKIKSLKALESRYRDNDYKDSIEWLKSQNH